MLDEGDEFHCDLSDAGAEERWEEVRNIFLDVKPDVPEKPSDVDEGEDEDDPAGGVAVTAPDPDLQAALASLDKNAPPELIAALEAASKAGR